MDVRNCRQCGSLYNYIGGSYKNLCPSCIAKLEEKFDEVKTYIEEHKGASISDVSRDCDVRTDQVERWIREERLLFAEDSPIGIPCENCGKTIKSGRYCDECKANMMNNLNSAYGAEKKEEPQAPQKRGSADPRMRFF